MFCPEIVSIMRTTGDLKTAPGLGLGFIIQEDGYLITNDHAIAGETDVSITVFANGEKGLDKQTWENVRIVAMNSDLDLALLKIETPDRRKCPTVPLGESDELKQRQPVSAIGTPLGLERSVSQGTISLKNRLEGGRMSIRTTTRIKRCLHKS